MQIAIPRPLISIGSSLERAIFSTTAVFLIAVAGVAVITSGVLKAIKPIDQDRVAASSAMVLLSQMGDSLRKDIANVVRPQVERTEILSRDPGLIEALKQNDQTRQTDVCNRAITQATEIDAFALFDQTGKIVAINTVYGSGKPIPAERVNRIMNLNFDKREIIQGCVRNGVESKILEFQTTCDITPAFFDSSGLSVAYSVPVIDPGTGNKLGVVSSRVRFERLTDLIRAHASASRSGLAEFVTDKGGYFSESINAGKEKPPIPVGALAGIVAPMVDGKVDSLFCKNGSDYLCLVRMKDFATLQGGGIQVMLIVKGEWLATEARQAKHLTCGTWIGGGLLLMLVAILIQGVRSRRQTEHWNRLLIDSALAAVITTDQSGKIEQWNPRAEKLFGYPATRARGQNLASLIVPKDLFEKSSSLLTPATDVQCDRDFEMQLEKQDGARLTANVSVTAMRIGKHLRFCIFMNDITEFKLAQSQLVQAQKLESIGQLAAGIAHEINTPAQYVGDNVRFLKKQFAGLMSVIDLYARQMDPQQPPTVWEERQTAVNKALEAADFEFLKVEIPMALEQSLDGLNRVIAIVGAMKDFSHPGSEHKEPADLNRAISSTIEVCRNRWKFVANLSTDFELKLPEIPCLVAEFNQVVLNLIVNAADAIGEKAGSDGGVTGEIHISTKRVLTAKGRVVEVRIRDNGPGIPEHIRERMFEPFFTTKAVGKGTGQGLTISRNVIVEKHGGELFFESTVGTGTTFVIRLPVAENQIQLLEAA